MIWDTRDTIAAIASPPGAGRRGLVRITGPRLFECLAASLETESDLVEWTALRRSTIVRAFVRVDAHGRKLPVDVYLWPDHRSYTRQPSAELHTVGNPVLLEAVLDRLTRHGARLARPGEFTLRAFMAGRLDLTQAEAVLAVIDAGDRRELDAALSQMAGGLSRPLHDLRSDLLDLLSHVEAGLDFAEEPIEFVEHEELADGIRQLQSGVRQLLLQLRGRAAGGGEPVVVLQGRPNAGKSCLLNALVGSEAAIVSPLAGTTRDVVTARVNWDGRTCLLVDTAGRTEAGGTHDPLDRAAQQQAARWQGAAELALLCVDAQLAHERRLPSDWEDQPEGRSSRLLVWTRCDLVSFIDGLPPDGVPTSAVTGAGIDELRRRILEELAGGEDGGTWVPVTAARCRECLVQAAGALDSALEVHRQGGGEELVADDLRAAAHALGEVAGEVYTDDLLDRIFSRFCIGK